MEGWKFVLFEKKGETLLVSEFRKKFGFYMRFNHSNVHYKWKADYSAFKHKGYNVVQEHICKSCENPAKKGCCDKYDKYNRSKRLVIHDIICVEESDQDKYYDDSYQYQKHNSGNDNYYTDRNQSLISKAWTRD